MQCKINKYIKLYLFLSQHSVFYKASPLTIGQTRGNTACLSTGRGGVGLDAGTTRLKKISLST